MFLPSLLANVLILCSKFFPVSLMPKTNVAHVIFANMRSEPNSWSYYSHYSDGNGIICRGALDSSCGVSFSDQLAFHRTRYGNQAEYPLGIWDMSLILIAKKELDAAHLRMEKLEAYNRIKTTLGGAEPAPLTLNKTKHLL